MFEGIDPSLPKVNHRYELRLDDIEASLAIMDRTDGEKLLSADQISEIRTSAEAMVAQFQLASRPPPEPTLERTPVQSRQRNMPNWGVQVEALTEQFHAMHDDPNTDFQMAHRMIENRAKIDAVKSAYPK